MDSMAGPTQAEVDALFWWHHITFPNGVKTKGKKGLRAQESEAEVVFQYPVAGKTLLDVGAWTGYFSFEAARRGAIVTSMDKPTWLNPVFRGRESFDLARRYLAPDVRDITRDVMDLRIQPVGIFDVVLFLGVLYHLKHPLYVLEDIAAATGEHLVLETYVEGEIGTSRPAMMFYPRAELVNDPTNWWGPNVQCVIDMLKTVGFARIEHVPHPTAGNRALFHAFK